MICLLAFVTKVFEQEYSEVFYHSVLIITHCNKKTRANNTRTEISSLLIYGLLINVALSSVLGHVS